MLRISPLLDVAISVCASLFLSSLYVFAVCVCTCSLFVSLLSFLFLPFFFSLACLPLFIERFQRSCSLIFLSTDQMMEQFLSVFSSTAPNFMLSRDPFFSFFSLLFVPLLFKLPLFSLWHPHFSTFQAHFHQTVFLTFWWCHFLIHFSAFVFVFVFVLLDLCLSFAFVLGSRLWTWLIYIYIYIYCSIG